MFDVKPVHTIPEWDSVVSFNVLWVSTEMGSIAWDNCDTVAMSWKIHLCTGLMMISLFDVFWEYESIREFFLWWLACVGPQYMPIYISGIGIFCTSSGKPTQAHPKTPFFLTWTWKWTKWTTVWAKWTPTGQNVWTVGKTFLKVNKENYSWRHFMWAVAGSAGHEP